MNSAAGLNQDFKIASQSAYSDSSFRGARRSPKGEGGANLESITTVGGYGFRLSRFALGRNDE